MTVHLFPDRVVHTVLEVDVSGRVIIHVFRKLDELICLEKQLIYPVRGRALDELFQTASLNERLNDGPILIELIHPTFVHIRFATADKNVLSMRQVGKDPIVDHSNRMTLTVMSVEALVLNAQRQSVRV